MTDTKHYSLWLSTGLRSCHTIDATTTTPRRRAYSRSSLSPEVSSVSNRLFVPRRANQVVFFRSLIRHVTILQFTTRHSSEVLIIVQALASRNGRLRHDTKDINCKLETPLVMAMVNRWMRTKRYSLTIGRWSPRTGHSDTVIRERVCGLKEKDEEDRGRGQRRREEIHTRKDVDPISKF